MLGSKGGDSILEAMKKRCYAAVQMKYMLKGTGHLAEAFLSPNRTFIIHGYSDLLT